MSNDAVTPNCPVCDQPPKLVISPTQAFCSNDDCRALMWDPQQPADVQLANEQQVTLIRDDLGNGA